MYTARVPLPLDPQQRGGVLKESHCPLLPGSVEGNRESPGAHCSPPVWHVAVYSWSPTAHCFPTPQQCGSLLKEFHCLLLSSNGAVH